MSTELFLNGKVITDSEKAGERLNIALQSGQLMGTGYLPDEPQDAQVYELENYVVLPDVIDSFISVSEPGETLADTYETAALSALKAGVTAGILSPLGYPKIDNPELVEFIQIVKSERSPFTYYPMGCLTRKAEGKSLAEVGLMKKAGAIAVHDGNSLEDTQLMVTALKYSRQHQVPIVVRPQETALIGEGNVLETTHSTILGLPGISPISELLRVKRDLTLLAQYGGQIHFAPLSDPRSVLEIAKAKADGLNVTCGTSPHYLWFSVEHLEGYNTSFKVWPPLRTESDRDELVKLVLDGHVDVIASDHFPVVSENKRREFGFAEFGASGLDTFLPSLITLLHKTHNLPLSKIWKMVSQAPATIFGLKPQGLRLMGAPSFSVWDLNQIQTVKEDDLISKGKNNPFVGQTLAGKCVAVVSKGQLLFSDIPVQSYEEAENAASKKKF